MRLDNKQVSANILNSGDNIIMCSCLQEAFFDIYSIEIQGESFIKKADRVIDGCPIIKLNVEYQNKEYQDVEFKLVASDTDEVFINETLLQPGFKYAQQLCEIVQEQQYIEHEPAPIEIVAKPSASMLKEQARNSQEQRIKKTLNNIYNKLNEQLQQQLHQAKTSMLQETLASQMQMQNQSQQKLDESVKGLQHEFTDLSKQLQKVARNFTDDAVAKFKGTVVEQCNALLQETNVVQLEQLQLQIKKNAVDAKAALQQNLKKSFQEKFQQLSAQHTEHHQQVQVFVEQQLQNIEQQIKLQQISTFEDSVAALMNEQSMFVDNVVNDKITFIQESLHSLSQQLQQTLLQQAQSSQSDAQQHLQQISEQVHSKLATVDNIVSSAVADASSQLTQHVDSLNASRLATVEQQVEQILREQFTQASQDTVVEEASQSHAISSAINKFKNQLNKDLQAQAANLQSELYRKFAVYVDSMGGGGGSVAVQYANGGTMNGSLNVATGQILSGGIDLYNIFSTTGASGYQTIAFNESNAQLTIAPNGNTISLSALSGSNAGPSGEPLFESWAQTNSANYESTYSTMLGNSANWNSTYSTVYAYSAAWGTGGSPQTLSFNESNALLTISDGNTISLSALSSSNAGPSGEPLFESWAQTNSANYESTFSTVFANSANWNYQGTDIKALTANWQSTYSTVSSQSANNDSVFATVQTYSATNWNYQGTDIKALTANWQSTYSTVSSTSASWSQTLSFDNATSVLTITPYGNAVNIAGVASGRYLPLSGGALTGALSTNQDIEITDVAKGIILKSPNGTKYRVTVSDAGELTTTLI